MKQFIHASFVIASLLSVAGCGGGLGSDQASISNIVSTTARYSQNLTVTVQGLELDGITMSVDGPCDGIAAAGTPTSTQVQFQCKVSGFGPIVAYVYGAQEGHQLGRISVNSAQMPQVTFIGTAGSTSGRFVVELDPVNAKITTDNFLAYVNSGFYSSTIIHRVVAGFVIQGGGYTTAQAAKPATFPTIVNEAGNGLKNLRGTIAMARTGDPNSATSQFFINLVDNPSLDPGGTSTDGYAVFGKVVSGLDVVDSIGALPTQNLGGAFANLPVTQVNITSATQTR